MLIYGDEIKSILPQREPMIMIEGLISCNENNCTTQLLVKKDNVFVINGELSEAGLIENMAQSAAARTGWLARESGNEGSAPIGVIGAIRDFKLFFLPTVGDLLQTSVNVSFDMGNASVVTSKILVKEKLAAECEMKIFLTS